MKIRRFGLIGFPLTHSFSKDYFTKKFKEEGIKDSVYQNFEIDKIEKFPKILQKYGDLYGLNVTIPYKEKIIKYLDWVDDAVREIHAVNTIKILHKNEVGISSLFGYNTDVYGFHDSLKPKLEKHHKRALVLGTGGAAKAVKFVLSKWLDIDFLFVSRNPGDTQTISYRGLNKDIIQNHQIIINTTPLGMYPKTESYPRIPYHYLSPHHLLYDLVYNPAQTKFLELGQKSGAKTINGSEMLRIQAERSWQLWQ